MPAIDDRENGLVLVVDDDPSMVLLITAWLRAEGFGIDTAGDGAGCIDALARSLPDCVLLDIRLPDQSGVEVLTQIRQRHPRLPVIMLTAEKSVDTVVAAMQAGAWDYLPKPLEAPKLQATVRNAVRQHRLATRVSQLEREAGGYEGMIAQSATMRQLFRHMDRVAATDVTVLIHGESGTGKELVARAIHRASGRCDGPFVAINCAAIAESLAASELFGHERGAFTGAEQRRIGRLEQADGGTLFLDEVAELDMTLQANLLRALQERRFHRLGGSQDVSSDFRLVAATHRRLEEQVRAGRFREDLFFRVAVFELEVPALRERDDDILLLARHFLPAQLSLAAATGRLLRAYPWPGNVRELANAFEHASVVATDGLVRPGDLPRRIRDHPSAMHATVEAPAHEPSPAGTRIGSRSGASPVRRLADVERDAIEDAMERTGGNVSEACRQLGIGRTTLYRKLERYGIARPGGENR